MVVKIPPREPFWTAITRIDRRAGETQEQFDATRGEATYQVGKDTYTLELDGKLDEEISKGVHAYYHDETLVTDIRSLASKTQAIKDACLESQDFRADPTVDLGTGVDWHVFPNYDTKNQTITSYDLISGPGPQSLNARFTDDGGLDLTVSSEDKKRDLRHSMRATFAADGSCALASEGVIWHQVPEKR